MSAIYDTAIRAELAKLRRANDGIGRFLKRRKSSTGEAVAAIAKHFDEGVQMILHLHGMLPCAEEDDRPRVHLRSYADTAAAISKEIRELRLPELADDTDRPKVVDAVRFARVVKDIARRPASLRGSGFAYQLRRKDATLALTDRGTRVLGVDTSRMCATAVITTGDVDRVGDIVEPQGCDLTAFKKNPTVFWGHQQVPFPIGIAEDPNGNLAIKIEPERILGTTYFHDKTIEAVQVFTLITMGIIRSTSIGF